MLLNDFSEDPDDVSVSEPELELALGLNAAIILKAIKIASATTIMIFKFGLLKNTRDTLLNNDGF